MSVLPDHMIHKLDCVTPCENGTHRPGILSFGLSSYGYDLRADYKWKVFTNIWGAVVDPKNFDKRSFVDVDLRGCDSTHGDVPNYVIVPPNSFALCSSIERIKVPRDCIALVIGKSTYARCGIVLNCTPLEPEWEGHVTLEVSNTTPLPAKVYAGEGIGQVLFFRVDHSPTITFFLEMLLATSATAADFRKNWKLDECIRSYADKSGKYQDQPPQVTLPIVT